jgi:YidC/Oxa1 family membrane protein insertase
MLEMQRLQPEMRRIQAEHRGDRQKMNEEMMKLYQGHKVNPLASCLPLLAQMPIFIIMFRALSGLINRAPDGTFAPKYLNESSELYLSLVGQTEMVSFGIDLSVTPVQAIQEDFLYGMIYVLLVAGLAGVYFIQQRMVASRTVSPTMSATQAKVLQYLPVVFAVFQLILPTSLVVYYFVQALVRIVQQFYITKRFYGNDSSLGRQAQAASAEAHKLTLGNPEHNQQLDVLLKQAKLREDETVLIGGPPCQAYSLVGRARNMGKQDYIAENDHRHFLYKEYLRILHRSRPAVFVMENVKGILSAKVGGNLSFMTFSET